jgi:putative ABC transport system substrate-binding protein
MAADTVQNWSPAEGLVVNPFRRAASYVSRILRGARSRSELPVPAATNDELATNVGTAKALGLTLPPMLLARADKAIQ